MAGTEHPISNLTQIHTVVLCVVVLCVVVFQCCGAVVLWCCGLFIPTRLLKSSSRKHWVSSCQRALDGRRLQPGAIKPSAPVSSCSFSSIVAVGSIPSNGCAPYANSNATTPMLYISIFSVYPTVSCRKYSGACHGICASSSCLEYSAALRRPVLSSAVEMACLKCPSCIVESPATNTEEDEIDLCTNPCLWR